MKKFIIKCSIFALVLFILAALLDFLLCKGLLEMEDYRFQDYSAMLEGGMDNDILIVGNSGAKAHYNTYIIDSVFNRSSFCIGAGGYPINVSLAKYNLYVEHNRKPKYVLLNIDSGTFWCQHDIRHQHQSEQFFPLIYDSEMRKELKKLGYGWKELFIPLFRFWGYQKDIKNGLFEALHLKHYVSMPAYKGFRAETGPWDGTNFEAMEATQADFGEEAKEMFEDFMAQCHSDSIKVVIIFSPNYYKVREKLLGLDEYNGWLDSFSAKYDFPYLNYMDNLPLSSDTSNFCNATHMNPTATDVFTRTLCNDLIESGIIPCL